jgi:hypothetical protein
MRRLQALRDRHRGQRCVIVANGPSLNRMCLAGLRHEHVIGMNKIFLGMRRFGFYPRYLVAVNPTVVQQSRAEIREMNCVKFIGARAARASGLDEDALTYIVDTDSPPARFSTDLSLGLHEGWTVTHAALQVAYHLGFADVVLIGLDHRYRFEGRPNESRRLEGADPNHFSEQYFGFGQNWDNPDLAESEASYRQALAAFVADGRRVRDATVDGACTVFPKADFEQIFSRDRVA